MFKLKTITKEPENEAKAYDYAVFLLSLSLRTVGEMRDKMQKRGYTLATIEKTIDQLVEQKYLDDQRYAEVYLENLKKYKTFGFYGIKKKLMEKRLPAGIIESVLSEGLGQEEEMKIARKFLKKAGVEVREKKIEEGSQYSVFNEEASKAKQKTAGRLKARGFRSEIISRLLA